MSNSNWKYFMCRIIKHIIVEGEPDPEAIAKFHEFYELCKDDNDELYEESFMLVHAMSRDHACKIAKKVTKKNDFDGENMFKQKVDWKLVDIIDVYEIMDKLESGAEVYSCLHSTKDSEEEFMDKWFHIADD